MEMQRFTLHEAAEILSNSICDEWGGRMPSEKMWAEMKDAFLTGALTFYDEYKQPLDLAKLRRMNDPRTVLYAPDYNLLGRYGETTTPEAINQWLASMGSPHRFPEPAETPAPPVAAVPATQASPEPVQAAPAKKARSKGWRQLALPYMAKIWRSDRFGTVKAYCKAIEERTNENDSPFVKSRGELVLKETGRPLSWKTIENSIGEIRAAAASLETP